MSHELAAAKALETGMRAMRLGVMLENYDDPDVGSLISESQRVGVAVGRVLA